VTSARGPAVAQLDRRVRREIPDGAPVLARFDRLLDTVAGLESCVLALSGGIDSSFLLNVASSILGPRCLAVTADSAAVPEWDRADAREAGAAAAEAGTGWRVISTRELDDPRYALNPRSRCFFCKTEVYGALDLIRRTEGLAWVVDGTNATDATASDRPGMAAAEELAVRSPLAEAGLTKEDIRVLARSLGMRDWDRPASACLSSRIPYGVRITPERLRRVESAELGVRALGFAQVRVRDLGTRARIEVDAAEVERLEAHRERVDEVVRAVGFVGWMAAAYTGSGAGDLRVVGR
jgi:pyridinium-3,5-biscarboxylic acid mononucleotide sulfurtransferase